MITRRNFLAGILAFGAAPAVCRAENLMKIFVPSQEIIRPPAKVIHGASLYITRGIGPITQDEFGETLFPTHNITLDDILSGGFKRGEMIVFSSYTSIRK